MDECPPYEDDVFTWDRILAIVRYVGSSCMRVDRMIVHTPILDGYVGDLARTRILRIERECTRFSQRVRFLRLPSEKTQTVTRLLRAWTGGVFMRESAIAAAMRLIRGFFKRGPCRWDVCEGAVYRHMTTLVTVTHVPRAVVHMVLILAQKDLTMIVSRMKRDNAHGIAATAQMADCADAVGDMAELCTDEDAMRMLVRIRRVVWDAQLHLLRTSQQA